jgi:predicted metal-dependent phosphoesterase TrpH
MRRLHLKLDLHVHSHFSADSSITTKELVFYAKKRGLDGVAITDHDRLEGALRIAKETDFLIIPGVEISSKAGHVTGLNVQNEIPSNQDVEETVERIHDAGGLALACHPYGLFKGGLGKKVTSKFDAVEVVNSSAFPFGYSAKRSRELALSLGIRSLVAGSDAHYGPEIGRAYTALDARKEIDEVVEAIRKGMCEPFGQATPLTLRFKKILVTVFKK